MKFDSITLLEQIIRESVFNELNGNMIFEQDTRISIKPGTDNQQQRRRSDYPGSVASFVVKSKGMNDDQIVSAIRDNTEFGSASEYANGQYAYTLGTPIRETANTKKYLVLIYPLNNDYYEWFHGSDAWNERTKQIQKLYTELNPSGATIGDHVPKHQIGTSHIYTESDWNTLKSYNEFDQKRLDDLKLNAEITVQQSQEIDRLKNTIQQQQEEIKQMQQSVETETNASVANLDDARAAAEEDIRDYIWKDTADGNQLKLAVGEGDEAEDYLITLENDIYMITTPEEKIPLADY